MDYAFQKSQDLTKIYLIEKLIPSGISFTLATESELIGNIYTPLYQLTQTL
jgi:hypothetical protein